MKLRIIKFEYPIILASIVLLLGGAAQSKQKNIQRTAPTLADVDNVAVHKKLFDSVTPQMYRPINTIDLDKIGISKIQSKAMFRPKVISASRTPDGVCYIFSNGEKVERCGGSIAWRNNNPGCIRYSDKIAAMGAIGVANKFAIFPDEETGMRAIKRLLLSDNYCNLSIVSAIGRYAPPHENNTERYIKSLCRLVGVQKHTKLCDLNDEQIDCVVNAIRRLEGWIIGTEKCTPAPNKELGSPNGITTPNKLITYYTQCAFFDRSI